MIIDLSKRLWLLLAILLLGLSSLYLLPKGAKQQPPPGVVTALPDFIGEWYGQDAAISERERGVLGSETRFLRKQYTNARGDSIMVSVIFSGEDMSISIHRPERCLPAQGYTMVDQHTRKIALENRHPLTVTRLHNLRPLFTHEGKPITTPSGNQANEFSLLYYWFVGCTETTASHTTRYFIDARDRFLKGATQPWAYVTVVSRITANLEKFGRTEAQTDALLQDFIQKLTPLIQQPVVQTR